MLKIKRIRKSFFEIINFLNSNKIIYWVGRRITEQIKDGLINDDEQHDIDFHVMISNKEKLINLLKINNYNIKGCKPYKILINAKSDSRRIEFVFLFPEDNFLWHQSKNKKYKCLKSLFDNHRVNINNVKVRIPYPLPDYISRIQLKNEK